MGVHAVRPAPRDRVATTPAASPRGAAGGPRAPPRPGCGPSGTPTRSSGGAWTRPRTNRTLWAMMGSSRPSAFAYTAAELAIRPWPARPHAAAHGFPIAACVLPHSRKSPPTRLPSMSRATRRMGNAASAGSSGDGPSRGRSIRARRARPARSGATVHRHRAAGSRDPRARSPPPGRRRSQAARSRPAPAPRQPVQQTAHDIEPVRAAVERQPGLEREVRRQLLHCGRGHVGQVPRTRGRSRLHVCGSRSAAMNTTRSATRVAHGVLAGQLERVLRRVDGDDEHRLVHRAAAAAPRTRLTAIAPVPVPMSATRSAGVPGGRGAAVSRRAISTIAASTSSSVSGRGMSARASVTKARPWNSRKPRM